MTDAVTIFRTVLGESSLPMAATQGRSHLVVYVNPAFCRLVGRSEEDLLGNPLPAVLGETGEADSSSLLDRVFSTGGAASVAMFREGGVQAAVHTTYAAWSVPATDERPAGLLVQMVDTSEHAAAGARAAQAAEELADVNRRLLQAGLDAEVRAETHAALNVALRQSERRLRGLIEEQVRLLASEQVAHGHATAAVRMRDQVMAALAHDLKNPLTTIRGHAGLAVRRVSRLAAVAATDGAAAAELTERLQEGLRQIQAGTEQMARWIDQLSDIARLQGGQPALLQRQPVDLVALVQRIAAGYQGAPGADGESRDWLRVEVGAPVVGEWDAARVERAIDNLIGNAVKYSPRRRDITVTVTREASTAPGVVPKGGAGAAAPHAPATMRAGDGAAPSGQWAIVCVRDRGVGIPAADLPHVFEPFHRAGNVVGSFDGSGIGLASVRQVVEQHGGTVAVQSVEGAGSTFTVRLPLEPGL